MSISEKVTFLEQLEIFSDLEEDELLDLAYITDEYEFDENAIIAYQRDVAENFIMVRNGRLFSQQVDNLGVVRDSRSYFPGQYLQDSWLFTPTAHEATLRGAGNGRIYCIERKKFLAYLDANPYLIEFLRLSENAEDIAATTSFDQPSKRAGELKLLPGERIRFIERRSIWLLVLQLLGPLVLFLIWTIFAALVLNVTGALAILAIALPGVVLFFFSVWRTMDWANDYFVITDNQLIHHEYSLRGFQVRINKMPIDQVQSVEIEKPSLVATVLHIGTANITTAAQHGRMRFDFIDNPRKVLKIINDLREHRRFASEGQTQVDMRVALEDHFQSEPALRAIGLPEAEEEEEKYEEIVPLVYQVAELLVTLLRGIFRIGSTRIEDGEVITYRKHPFTLLTKIWWLLLLSLILFSLFIWSNETIFRYILGGLWSLTAIGLGWRFLDWRNDVFQVTDLYVFDIDRLPLGFGESKKQAELANIQNVNAARPGFLATVFNYGDVYIETAGASADITFERVANPSLVQDDVFRRREALKLKQAESARSQRRKEYAVMLDVYHQAQQAGRVPDRILDEDIE